MQTPALLPWLQRLALANVILVPGGGPFADQVRQAQAASPFDDSTAHAMALLAMSQYGLMLTGLCPQLKRAHTLEEIRQSYKQGTTAVWLPDLTLLHQADIPHSWDVTADSLALWLADRLAVSHLLLVKSTDHTPPHNRLSDWMAAGIIDTAFADFLARTHVNVWLARAADYDQIAQGFSQPERAWVRLHI